MNIELNDAVPFEALLQSLPDIKYRDSDDYDAWTDGKSLFFKTHDAVCAAYDLLVYIYKDKVFAIERILDNHSVTDWFSIHERKIGEK